MNFSMLKTGIIERSFNHLSRPRTRLVPRSVNRLKLELRTERKRVWSTGFSLLAMLAFVGNTQAQIAEKKTLTLDGARKVIAAAEAEARAKNAPGGAIAVVDDGGNLIAVERLDGTFAAAGPVSVGKARTAALFQKPTSFFEDVIRKGRTPLIALNDFTPLQGGVPIIVDGQVVGAIGVSGAASAQQDEELAMAGAAAFSTTQTPNQKEK